MTKGERIRKKRKEAGFTLDYVASKVSVSRQTMSRYETGVLQNIPSDKIESIAMALGTTPSYLMGWENENGETDLALAASDIKHGTNLSDDEALAKAERMALNYRTNFSDKINLGSNVTILEDERLVRFPVIGSISAGYSGLAVEEYTGDYSLIPLSDLRSSPDDYFVLHVSGDSMYPRLLDGDRVLVRRVDSVENGKVAIVLYNGDEATIKKVNYQKGEYIELAPYNPEYKIKRIEGVDLEQCHVLGEVVQLIRNM